MVLLILYALVVALLLSVLKYFGADASLIITWGAAFSIPFFFYTYSLIVRVIKRKNGKKIRRFMKRSIALKKTA